MSKSAIRRSGVLDLETQPKYQKAASRFARSRDFKFMVLYVSEGLVRMGSLTKLEVLKEYVDQEGAIDETFYVDKLNFPAINEFINKVGHGLKKKAFGMLIKKAVNCILDDSSSGEQKLSHLVDLADRPWEEISHVSLPAEFMSNDSKIEDVKPESNAVEETDEGPELEMDDDILNDLVDDLDLDSIFEEEKAF